ncbi:MAG: proteasome subunit alpha [Acidimicrobiia bacterium]|nr:proteasome subunit alpha [Acidimicrobiia bacterium]MBT8192467.1 proteasome subunit alpha [Acidimicrobiia bacterium]NNF89517.1 proteasome subunit alpha [Acidimicrobiia bacterium]NNL14156.1 proteasome subunit alpha [Acidimicrobiia bacterium]NNL97103.1 proteasome subunit alpha [Acidimicrobiia bacterium]
MTLPYYVPPEQLMKDRAEFAQKGIAKGRSIIAVEYADGVLMLAENSSRALNKIGEIYDRMAFAGVGKYNEFEALRVAGIRHADLKGYSYGRSDVAAKSLANAYSQTLAAVFTESVKPYEIEILIVEVGDDPAGTSLFRVRYDGTLVDEEGFCAIGGQEDELTAHMKERYEGGMDLRATIRFATEAFEAVEEREIGPDEWEAAVLDRTNGRRMFRRLDAGEITAARS